MSEFDVLFLDANALASPVTRTLLITGTRADAMRVVWSADVEAEADRHARGSASRVFSVRTNILGIELPPSAAATDVPDHGLGSGSPGHRRRDHG